MGTIEATRATRRPITGPAAWIGADMKKGLRSEALSHGRFEDQRTV